MRSSPAEVERLFLALIPDAVVQQKMASLISALPIERDCRKMPTKNIHLTLVFIGSFPVSLRDQLTRRIGEVPGSSFELVFERLVYHKRRQMLWLEAMVPECLGEFVSGLRRAISEFDVAIEERPFSAHVTLVRKLRHFLRDRVEFEPIVWPVTEYALVRSKTYSSGAEYEVLERFRLMDC